MRFLFIGDIVGRPGRRAVSRLLPELRDSEEIDFVIANGENASGGAGLVAKSAQELFKAGVDVITGGNHTFHNKDVYQIIDADSRILRPANYPPHPGLRGRGWSIYDLVGGYRIAVINLLGTVMMKELENPFHCVDEILDTVSRQTPNIVVDMHAEATSEKVAMGWYLDGRATAVMGTHTHVPTADEGLLPEGTAYQTDVGMTGPFNSVIGVTTETIITGFLSKLPVRHTVAAGDVRMCAALVDFDPETGRAQAIRRLMLNFDF